jgi:hypothetical protein
MPPDDTTTIRIFDKLDSIGVDVGIIKDKMPHLATKDHVDLKIAEHAALPSKAPKANGRMSMKMTAAIIAAFMAVTGTVVALTQML